MVVLVFMNRYEKIVPSLKKRKALSGFLFPEGHAKKQNNPARNTYRTGFCKIQTPLLALAVKS